MIKLRKKIYLLLTPLVLFSISSFANIDSLQQLLNSEIEDTTRIKILNSLGESIYQSNPDSAVKLWNIGMNLCDEKMQSGANNDRYLILKGAMASNKAVILYYKGEYDEAMRIWQESTSIDSLLGNILGAAQGYNNMAQVLISRGKTEEAITYFERGMNLTEGSSHHKFRATCLGNLAYCYSLMGKVKKSIDYYHESISLALKHDIKESLATSYSGIATIHLDNGNYDEALKYFEECLLISKQLKKFIWVSEAYSNIAQVYNKQGDLHEALEYYQKTMALNDSINYKKGLGISYHNAGGLAITMGNFKEAKAYVLKAIQIFDELGYVAGIQGSFKKYGDILKDEGNLDSAQYYYEKSIELAYKTGQVFRIKEVAAQLNTIYAAKAMWQKAYETHVVFKQMSDSVLNDDNKKALMKGQLQFEQEKEQLIKQHEAERLAKKKQQEINRRNNLQYSGIFMIVLLLFALVLFSGRISLSPKLLEGLIFFTFLLFFEFCLVLLDPQIEQISNGQPAFKLALNAVLAIAIFPLHSYFEKALKKRIVKNS